MNDHVMKKINSLCFGLVSLFNGILGELCQSHPCRTEVILFDLLLRDKMVHAFAKGIIPKVNITERLECELTYF